MTFLWNSRQTIHGFYCTSTKCFLQLQLCTRNWLIMWLISHKYWKENYCVWYCNEFWLSLKKSNTKTVSIESTKVAASSNTHLQASFNLATAQPQLNFFVLITQYSMLIYFLNNIVDITKILQSLAVSSITSLKPKL